MGVAQDLSDLANRLGSYLSPPQGADPYAKENIPETSFPGRLARLLLLGEPGSGGVGDTAASTLRSLFGQPPQQLTGPGPQAYVGNPNFRQQPWAGREGVQTPPGQGIPSDRARIAQPTVPYVDPENPTVADPGGLALKTLSPSASAGSPTDQLLRLSQSFLEHSERRLRDLSGRNPSAAPQEALAPLDYSNLPPEILASLHDSMADALRSSSDPNQAKFAADQVLAQHEALQRRIASAR